MVNHHPVGVRVKLLSNGHYNSSKFEGFLELKLTFGAFSSFFQGFSAGLTGSTFLRVASGACSGNSGRSWYPAARALIK